MMRGAIYLFVLWIVCGCDAHGRRESNAEESVQLAEAKRLFADGCKRAGEVIHRTVPDVQGIMLLKLRPTDYSAWNKNAVDPYGYDFDWGYKDKPQPYISTFLIGRDEKGHLVERDPAFAPGYRYIEAVDSADGKRYRYTGSRKVVGRKDETAPNVQINLQHNPSYDLNLYDFVVERAPAPSDTPRYGITYDDISTKEERQHWIAGSSLKVIDLKTDEVIAERIGYMVDLRLGATPNGRQPWTFARTNKGWSCPELRGQSYGARRFVEKVLLIPDN
jgi:hypothetical protein